MGVNTQVADMAGTRKHQVRHSGTGAGSSFSECGCKVSIKGEAGLIYYTYSQSESQESGQDLLVASIFLKKFDIHTAGTWMKVKYQLDLGEGRPLMRPATIILVAVG